MINYLIEVSICWTGFYLLYILLLSKETFFKINRGYLLGTLVLGLALPLFDFSQLWVAISSSEATPANYFETITITVQSLEENVEAVVVAPIVESLSVFDVLLWIYWAGVAFMFFRFIVGLAQIGRLYFKNEKQKTGDYTLISTNENHLPFSFFNLFFKSKNLQLNPADQTRVTEHELAHIKGWHSVDVILLELASIILWCSPLVHFYKKSLRNIHEYLADANVLQTTSKKHYGQLLLQLFQTSPGVALANNFIHSQLKKRIKMMTKTPSSKRAYWKYLFALPLLGLLTMAFTESTTTAQETTIGNTANTEVTYDQTDNSDDPIFTVVEEMPRFKGCEDITDKKERKDCADRKLLTFVAQNIKYPKAAQKAGIEGVSVIKFIIDKTGKVTSPKIIRTIGGGCDEEALRVISMMPDFIPGKQRGKNVSVYFNLPVRFKLSDDKPTEENKLKCAPHPPTPENCNVNSAALGEGIDGEIFNVVEDMPRFPGCEHITDNKDELKTCWQSAMINFIFEQVKFPEEAKKAGVEGVVVTEFVVSKTGEVLNPQIVRSIGMGCDEAVLSAIEQMNAMEKNWIPGKQRGKAVNVRFVLPVKFKLTDDVPSENAPEKIIKNNTLGVNKLIVTPNPTIGNEVTITYELDAEAKQLNLRVTDLNGKLIKAISKLPTQRSNTITVDISKLASGSFFISLIDGDKIYTEQVVKAAQ